MAEREVRLPGEWTTLPISPTAFRILAVISKYAYRSTGSPCLRSYAALALEANVDRSTVKRCIASLKNMGLLRLTYRGINGSHTPVSIWPNYDYRGQQCPGGSDTPGAQMTGTGGKKSHDRGHQCPTESVLSEANQTLTGGNLPPPPIEDDESGPEGPVPRLNPAYDWRAHVGVEIPLKYRRPPDAVETF